MEKPTIKCTKCQAIFTINVNICPRCNNNVMRVYNSDGVLTATMMSQLKNYDGLAVNEKYDAIFKLADALVGTCGSIEATIKRLRLDEILGIETDSIESMLMDLANIDRCPNCEWWVDCGELYNGNDKECACANCRS